MTVCALSLTIAIILLMTLKIVSIIIDLLMTSMNIIALVSFVKWHINLCGFFNTKSILVEEQ